MSEYMSERSIGDAVVCMRDLFDVLTSLSAELVWCNFGRIDFECWKLWKGEKGEACAEEEAFYLNWKSWRE